MMKRIVLLVGIMGPLLWQGVALGEEGWKGDGVVICWGTAFGVWKPTTTIAPDGQGGAIIAWTDDRGSDESIYAQRVDSTGEVLWPENGICLRSDTEFPGRLGTMSDGRGGAIVVWQDSPSDLYLPLQIRAQRVDSVGVPRWGSQGIVVTSDPYAWEYWSRIVTDGDKGAIVAWVEWCYYGDSSSTRLYTQRVDSLGRLKWESTGVLVCNEATVLDWFPGMVSDKQDGSFITWEDSRAGDRSIYAQRIDSSGILQWAPGGISACTAGDIQDIPLVVRSLDGSIITWIDKRSGDWDIYAQRIDGEGGIQWESNGVEVCTVPGTQGGYGTGTKIGIVADSYGGGIICWDDKRFSNHDIYIQRLNSLGEAQWEDNGVFVISAADSTQESITFAIAGDNRSGAIVAWTDYRAGNWDIYCQRVDSSGVLQWGEGSLGVCANSDAQIYPVMEGDGEGGAIIAWKDGRGGGSIYTQRVDSSGNLRWGGISDESWGDALPREVSLEQNWPNPFNSATTIPYHLPAVSYQRSAVNLKIFNLLGQEVRTLVNEKLRPARYEAVWNGRNNNGLYVGSGIYFYQLKVGRFSQTRKMLLLR